MIAIKDMEMPKGCQRCKFFRKHMFGNGLDYSYSCVLGATEFPMPWIRQMDERASDCPLTEILTCKDCKWWKDSDGMFRRGIYAESRCPMNHKEVYEGTGYCFMFEPRESEE